MPLSPDFIFLNTAHPTLAPVPGKFIANDCAWEQGKSWLGDMENADFSAEMTTQTESVVIPPILANFVVPRVPISSEC